MLAPPIEAALAKRLLAAYDIALKPNAKAKAYDYAMKVSSERGLAVVSAMACLWRPWKAAHSRSMVSTARNSNSLGSVRWLRRRRPRLLNITALFESSMCPTIPTVAPRRYAPCFPGASLRLLTITDESREFLTS